MTEATGKYLGGLGSTVVNVIHQKRIEVLLGRLPCYTREAAIWEDC